MNYRNHFSPRQFPTTWASAWGEDRYGLWMTLAYQGASLTFRWIIPGTFMMGSPDGSKKDESAEKGRASWEDRREVTLEEGFWLADIPVTQAFWQAVNGDNPSYFKDDDSLPVEKVSWDDVQAFIQKLNQLHPDLTVRLPWEAEWEYACRAGTKTAFHFGDEIDASKANYRGVWEVKDIKSYENDKEWGKDAFKKTTPVKSYLPNSWGLYDMHGNVWEWCQDEWQEHLGTEPVILSPSLRSLSEAEGGRGVGVREPPEGEQGLRVVRGGSWLNVGRYCRSAARFGNSPGYRNFDLGFRLVLGHPSSSAAEPPNR